jgi:hypothetical protein
MGVSEFRSMQVALSGTGRQIRDLLVDSVFFRTLPFW